MPRLLIPPCPLLLPLLRPCLFPLRPWLTA